MTSALVLAGVLTSGRVFADDAATEAASRAAEVAKLNEDGMNLYRARDYRHAIEKFLHAQALDQDPNLLYNIARCYEMLGERGAAIEKYEAFLAKPDADPQGKRRAQEAIRNLRQASHEAPAQPASTTAAAASAGPAASPATAAAPGTTLERKPSETTPEEASFWNARVVTLGMGVLVTAAGAAVYMLGVSDHSKVTSSVGYGTPGQIDPLTEAEAHRLVDSGNTKKLIGEITMGAGGALLITSAILALVHASEDGSPSETSNTSPVTLRLAPTRTGGGVILEGRF
jgi:tetratricopeptide (TPR) repeat protein